MYMAFSQHCVKTSPTQSVKERNSSHRCPSDYRRCWWRRCSGRHRLAITGVRGSVDNALDCQASGQGSTSQRDRPKERFSVLPSQRLRSVCLFFARTAYTQSGDLLRSLRKLKIPRPSFDKRRPNGRWHGNTQVTHHWSRMIRMMTVVTPSGRRSSAHNLLGFDLPPTPLRRQQLGDNTSQTFQAICYLQCQHFLVCFGHFSQPLRRYWAALLVLYWLCPHMPRLWGKIVGLDDSFPACSFFFFFS